MRLIASVLLASLALPALAQDPAPVTLPTVSTDLKRSKDVLPYKMINEVLLKMDRYGEGLFRMDFSVSKQKTTVPLDKLRMVVRSDDADHPIRIDAEGRFKLPMLPEAEGQTADLATNATPEQKVAVRGSVELNTRAEELDMAKVRQIVRVGYKLREELLPWYLRWLFPRIEAVRACSATPGMELEWRENGQLLGLALPTGERDPKADKDHPARLCTLLTGQERWPDGARLVAPAGTELSVKLQGQ
ncbi:MAG: hypothetical protein DI603_05485 [Roseateles depolymerans]|uniref:DUF2987 domain-containing protein n=1 Tax=Roseateles depolymerans TaxID=76731 RepID=A0A2W5FXP9_9BURK|nr:MAG: hypothetical protein DI603_05485 [Roseateles depolymerans]